MIEVTMKNGHRLIIDTTMESFSECIKKAHGDYAQYVGIDDSTGEILTCLMFNDISYYRPYEQSKKGA